jgi:hypothetical protein
VTGNKTGNSPPGQSAHSSANEQPKCIQHKKTPPAKLALVGVISAERIRRFSRNGETANSIAATILRDLPRTDKAKKGRPQLF